MEASWLVVYIYRDPDPDPFSLDYNKKLPYKTGGEVVANSTGFHCSDCPSCIKVDSHRIHGTNSIFTYMNG